MRQKLKKRKNKSTGRRSKRMSRKGLDNVQGEESENADLGEDAEDETGDQDIEAAVTESHDDAGDETPPPEPEFEPAE